MPRCSCQIHFDEGNGRTICCGKPAVADCADCGIALCAECRTECCGETFCAYCYDYHVTYSCLRKAVNGEPNRRREGSERGVTRYFALTAQPQPAVVHFEG
jgi:hypothetical protein